jgi:hypothetical protein
LEGPEKQAAQNQTVPGPGAEGARLSLTALWNFISKMLAAKLNQPISYRRYESSSRYAIPPGILRDDLAIGDTRSASER